MLGGFAEETASWEFDKDCDAEIFLATTGCARKTLTSFVTRHLRLHIGPPNLPRLRRSSRRPRPARSSPSSAQTHVPPVPTPARRPAAVTTLDEARVATAAWVEDTRAGLGDTVTTLAHGTALLVGSIDSAADGSGAPSLASRSQQGLLRQLVEGSVLTQR